MNGIQVKTSEKVDNGDTVQEKTPRYGRILWFYGIQATLLCTPINIAMLHIRTADLPVEKRKPLEK
jgi:hypothetical protein